VGALVYRLIMRPDTTTTLLKTVRRRLWLLGLIDRLILGFVFASAVLGVAALLHTFLANIRLAWWAPLALLPIAAAAVAAAFSRPSLAASARAADRWLDTHDLLTTAWYLKSRPPDHDSAAARVVQAQADQLAAKQSAAKAPRSLPRPGGTRRPLPVVVAVAVSATSLFLLSLDGVAPTGHLPNPTLGGPLNRNDVAMDDWASVLEPGARDEGALTEGRPATPQPADRPTGPASGAPPQGPPVAQADGRGDSGDSAVSAAARAAQGAGAGPVASAEPPARSGRQDSDGAAAPAEVRTVDVRRRPDGEGLAVDRAVSVELIPVSAARRQPAGNVRDAPAARVGRQPFSPGGGPAHSALQARYFEEARNSD